MRFRSFGRQIFNMYEKYPMTLNSIFGGMVYMAGEVTIQINHPNNSSNGTLSHKDENIKSDVINSSYQQQCMEHYQKIDGKRTIKIGMLGAVENGVFMLTWYRFLNHVIGTGVSTKIVVIKCLCDQLFFATQQDFFFLALCAYQDSAKLPAAIAEVKLTFLRTWLMDCSLWPMVNFVGFAWVPYRLQPTYMAIVQFFWQVYVSSIAATGTGATNNSTTATSTSAVITSQSSSTNTSKSTSSIPSTANNSNSGNTDNNCTTANNSTTATDKDLAKATVNSFHNIVEQEIRRNAKEESIATSTTDAADANNIVDKSVANATRGVSASGNESSTSTTTPPSTATTATSTSDAVLYQVFQRIDSDSSGYIDGTELTTELSSRYRRRISRIELEKIIQEVDVNGDGKISFEEFKRAIQSGTAKETGLWCALREDVTLLRGAQAIIKRKQILDSKHTANNSKKDNSNNNSSSDKDKENNESSLSPTYDSNCTAKHDDDLTDAVVSASIGFGLLAVASLIRRVIFKI